jgi:HAD superfamily hydrolase (TIGR01549 family)
LDIKKDLNLTHYCFDMDGTLVDSNKTIYNATTITLTKLGIKHKIDENEFSKKIGQHFNDIFNAFDVVVPDFEEYIKLYKQIYMEQMGHSKLYSDVKNVLVELKNRGNKISLLTTKAQDQAEKIIDYFGLNNYFNLIMGRRDGVAHKPSPEPLQMICKELNVEINQTLMIGDTELDIQCGKNTGSFTCGVLYGYRTKELIEIEKPDFIIGSMQEILTLNHK